jgi:hypothetical protein
MQVGLVVMSMTGDRERTEGGEFTEETTLAEVLAVFERVSVPSLMTGEVADALDISSESARQKLLTLSDQGRVATRKAGRTRLWWRTADESTAGSTREDHLPAVVDVTHDFYSREVQATFDNGVVLTVTYQTAEEERGYAAELTHPTVKTETWGDTSVERPPAELLTELLDDFYNADEERDTKIPHLDAFMQEVADDE